MVGLVDYFEITELFPHILSSSISSGYVFNAVKELLKLNKITCLLEMLYPDLVNSITHNQLETSIIKTMYLFWIFKTRFLCIISCPRTCLVDQAGLELLDIHMPLPRKC